VKSPSVEYWAPAVVWLVVMFAFSTDMMSSQETSRFIVPILTFFFPSFSPEEITLWHGVIRKFAHIAEYFLLACLVYRTIRFKYPDLLGSKLRTIAFVTIAALLDEYHQSLTVSRTASIIDVGYDCLGAVWALWLITSYESRRLRPHSVL
jgi:VanZ family protein